MAQTFAIEPLEDTAFRLSGRDKFDGGDATGTFNDRVFADMIGVAYRTLKRWRAAGGTLTWDAADKAAIRHGSHPLAIWGPEWMDLDSDEWGDALADEAAATVEAVVG